MCGIAGLWRFGGAADDALLAEVRTMTDAIAYRGPDGDGFWLDAGRGLAFGHRRLAIIDLSETGHQPMASANGRIVITYNGELYNAPEIASKLSMSFRGASDTEILVEAIARFGIEWTLRRANGLFAFAAFDRETGVLHLARDHLGIKPLYFTRQHALFAFASELKALRAIRGLSLTIDPAAVGAYLRHACVPAPQSIYQEVGKLIPGERIELTPDKFERHTYWSALDVAKNGQAAPTNRSFEAVTDELQAVLADAVKRQMVSDVPLGAFLSGGIDSSTVVALMRASTNGAVKTFSIGFREEAFNEADCARRIAEHLGTEHTELILSADDALSLVPKMPSIYDEPFADSSQLPTFLVSQLARSGVVVALSGDGGDEAFGGYVRYRGVPTLWNVLRYMPQRVRKMAAGGVRMLSPAAWDALAPCVPRRLRPTHFGDKVLKGANLLDAADPIDMYGRLISQWPDPERLMTQAIQSSGWVDRLGSCIEGLEPTVQMRVLDMMSYLPDDILTKVDRAAMAVSLEVRVPLIDKKVIEFAWTLPKHHLMQNGQGKRVLRAVLNRYVPESMFDRPKMGFGVPIGTWLRGPLKGWAQELLAPEALRKHGLFDEAILRERWQEHQSGLRNWQHALWAVLQFQAWYGARP
jgi:asparagine synthase (glutamine-hydrolysing)